MATTPTEPGHDDEDTEPSNAGVSSEDPAEGSDDTPPAGDGAPAG